MKRTPKWSSKHKHLGWGGVRSCEHLHPLFFVITDKTLKSIEKLVENLKQLGIKDVNGELVYDEEEAGYEYLQ